MRIRPRNFTIGTAGYLAVRLLWYIRQQMFRYSIRLFRTPIVKFRGLLRHDISLTVAKLLTPGTPTIIIII